MHLRELVVGQWSESRIIVPLDIIGQIEVSDPLTRELESAAGCTDSDYQTAKQELTKSGKPDGSRPVIGAGHCVNSRVRKSVDVLTFRSVGATGVPVIILT